MRPTAAPSRGVAFELAGEEGDAGALVRQARQRARSSGRRRGAFDLAQLAVQMILPDAARTAP